MGLIVYETGKYQSRCMSLVSDTLDSLPVLIWSFQVVDPQAKVKKPGDARQFSVKTTLDSDGEEKFFKLCDLTGVGIRNNLDAAGNPIVGDKFDPMATDLLLMEIQHKPKAGDYPEKCEAKGFFPAVASVETISAMSSMLARRKAAAASAPVTKTAADLLKDKQLAESEKKAEAEKAKGKGK